MTALQPKLHVNGFAIDPNWRATVTESNYNIFGPDNTYSSYTFMVTLKRHWLAGLLKGIVPAGIILLSGFLSLLMRSDKIIERLTVSSAALVGMVIYHLDLTSSVPPLGYLTYADMFMIVNYLCLLLMIFETVLMMEFLELKREKIINKIYVFGAYTTPIIWIFLQALCWYYYFVYAKGVAP